ncbi:hypothetical protein Goari_010100, partial [Gossypium aridum]|nr:hypothetical protein [Gossypium aridum]
YPEVPLFHEKVANSSLRFVVDKVQNKLQGRDVRSLSLVVNVDLEGLSEEIEHMVHQFVWRFSSSGKDVALVYWEDVQVLRAKYGVAIGIPETLSCSRGLLVNPIPGHASLDLDYSLNGMVANDGTWNLDLFRLWLSETVIRKIIGIPLPHSTARVDKIIWGGTRTSTFSLVLKQRLLTNTEKVQQLLNHSSACRVCGYTSEDVLNGSFQICRIIMTFALGRLNGSELLGLLSGVFGRIIIFSSFRVRLGAVIILLRSRVGNTVGSVRHENGYAAAGGVMRIRNGEWITGFNRFLGSYSMFKTSSLEVLTVIQESLIGGSNSALIRRILQLLYQIRHWNICYILREENQEAD